MNPRFFVKLVFILFFVFILHLFLYYFWSVYSEFFKWIKYNKNNENVVKTGSIDYTNNTISSYTWKVSKSWSIQVEKNPEVVIEEKVIDNFSGSIKKSNNSEWTWELILSFDNQTVLDLFATYKLVKLSSHSSLFDLTTEYPDPYLEYYSTSKWVTLYIFTSKNYTDVLNIFEVISYNLPFKTKKVNNFWDKSFFINIDQSLDDEYTRFVFSYKNKVFWLKIKKDSYNEIKDILNKLK